MRERRKRGRKKNRLWEREGRERELVVCLCFTYVPSTARSFRDGTPIYCPLRRTWSSVFTPFPLGIEPQAVAWQSIIPPLRHASSPERESARDIQTKRYRRREERKCKRVKNETSRRGESQSVKERESERDKQTADRGTEIKKVKVISTKFE